MKPTHVLRTWNGTTIYGVRLRKDCYQVGFKNHATGGYVELPQVTSEVADHNWTVLPVETEGVAV
jgi:hypothetical protein